MADSIFIGRGVTTTGTVADGQIAVFDGATGLFIKGGSGGGSGYVSSITGTANQITASAATGAVTLSIPSVFIAPGSMAATTTMTSPEYIFSGGQSLVGTTQDVTTLARSTNSQRFVLGLASNLYPALNRSTTGITMSLGDGTAGGFFTAPTITASSTLNVGSAVLTNSGTTLITGSGVIAGGNLFTSSNTSALGWSNRAFVFLSPADNEVQFTPNGTTGVRINVGTNGTFTMQAFNGADTAIVKSNVINATGAFQANGVAGVTTFGPAAVASITVKQGIITAIS